MSKSFVYLLVIALFIACNNANQTAENVINEVFETNARSLSSFKKYFEGVELPQFIQTIDNQKDANITTSTGAEIFVPENAFVDKKGKEVKGQVTVKYKEIKSPSEIIIENIDMTYDSAGISYPFQTAGMFDLRVYRENEEVFLKKGKKIELNYISNKQGNYNVYHYGKKWNYQGVSKGEIPLNAETDQDNEVLPLKPVKSNPDNDLILNINITHKNIDELKMYKKVLWKYTGDLSTEEVSKILSLPVSKTALTPSGKAGNYLYSFTTSKGDYQFPVAPVFQPNAYKKALKKYEDLVAKNTPQVKVIRKVNISELGLMNYDILYHRSDALVVDAQFIIKDIAPATVKGLPLFHITGEDDVVVDVNKQPKFYYTKNLNNKIVAVLPDKKVAVMSNAEFINTVTKASEGNPVKFELRTIDKQIKSSGELDSIISSL